MNLHRLAGMIALIAMLLTGLVIGQLSSLSPIQSSPTVSHSTGASVAATNYYDALNHLLATEDPTALRAMLHPEFTDHSTVDASVRTGGEFETFLTELSRTVPGLHLEATITVAQEEIVGATIAQSVPAQSVSDGVLLEFAPSSTQFEMLMVESGKIIERWSNPSILAPGRVETPARVEVDIPDQRLDLYLNRITLERFTRLSVANELGAIVMVESGHTELVIDPAIDDMDTSQAWTSGTLAAGDVRFVQPGAPFWITNTGAASATLLAATLDDTDHTDYARLQLVGSPVATDAQPGLTHDLLAFGPGTRPVTGAFELSLKLIDLAPGSAVADHVVQESEFAYVINGEVEVIISDGTVRQKTPQGTTAMRDGQVDLASGEAISVSHGASLSYRASGGLPVQLMLISISPVRDE